MTFAGPLAYAGIFVAAIIEGEIVFIAAAVLVAAGKLNPFAVVVAGALGAATGDQLVFYALRGRVTGWLTRFRPVAARHASIVTRVRSHQSLMILLIRFAPGLRLAITAACAYGDVPAARFTVLNLVAAFTWAAVILTVVSRIGPGALQHAGVTGIWGAVLPAGMLALFVWWLGRDLAPKSDSVDHTQSSVR